MDLRTGPAFGPIKNGLINVYPPFDRDETCDVAVGGAGIAGALASATRRSNDRAVFFQRSEEDCPVE